MDDRALCLEQPHQAQHTSISTEFLGCGQVSGLPNYSDEDEKDRFKDTGRRAGWGSTGQKEDCCLRLAGKYRDPLSNFQAPPARPGRRLHRPDQGRRRTELAWTGFIFSQLPAVHLLLSTSPFLPATGIPSFLPSLPFFYPSPLHSSKNFSIFDQSDIQNVAQRQCQGLGHARKYPMPRSVHPQKNSLAPTAEATTSRASQPPAPSTRSSPAPPIDQGQSPRSP